MGITSGASTPDELVQELIDTLRRYRKIEMVPVEGEEENVVFKLPDSLKAVNTAVNTAVPIQNSHV